MLKFLENGLFYDLSWPTMVLFFMRGAYMWNILSHSRLFISLKGKKPCVVSHQNWEAKIKEHTEEAL